jgi:hypothetical protein
MVMVGLSEYIAERFSIRSRAASAEDISSIGVPITLKKMISPLFDGFASIATGG